MPRNEVPQLCEQLHFAMRERAGASFYYPNITDNAIVCRYEWLRKWRGQAFGLHIGMVLHVGDDDLREITAYVTTNEAVEDNRVELPTFYSNFLARLQQESIQTLQEAIERLKPEAQKARHIVFHIRLHPQMAFETETQIEEKRIKLFPSTVTDEGELVSAVSVTVDAPSDESGKPKALRDIVLLCALLTLANGSFCESATLNWKRKRPRMQFLDSLEEVDVKRLYPSFHDPPVQFDKRLPERLNFIWQLYHHLTEENREKFLPALLAYYSGQSIHSKYSTQAIVAYVAALSSLAEGRKQACSGQLTCSECGNLLMKHNLVGDKAAIVSLINDMVQPTSEQKHDLERLLNRVYYKQRSAFVHAAELRHEEFLQDFRLPLCFPTAEGPVRGVFFYKQDFLSIQRITRRTLLRWLSQQATVPLDKELLNLDELPIIAELLADASISLPANTEVVPFHDGREQSKTNEQDS